MTRYTNGLRYGGGGGGCEARHQNTPHRYARKRAKSLNFGPFVTRFRCIPIAREFEKSTIKQYTEAKSKKSEKKVGTPDNNILGTYLK